MTKQNSFLVLLLLLSGFVYADTDLSGFVKLNYLNYHSAVDSKVSDGIFQINRLSLSHSLTENLSFETSYELTQIYTHLNESEFTSSYLSAKRLYRAIDFNSTLTKHDPKYILNQNLDRLVLAWTTDTYSLSVGRQQIAFGSGRTVNPTDVFTPFNFSAIDTEVRNGVDALRFRHQLGEMGQIDLGILFGEDAKVDQSAAYALAKVTVGHFEVQPSFSIFQNSYLFGLDINTTINGSSAWLESAWVEPNEQKIYFRGVLGTERQIYKDISFFCEYHFNGAGASSPSKYVELETDFAYQKGGVFLLGRNYLDVGSNFQLTPLHQMFAGVKTNIDDRSVLLNIIWEWNSFENFYFNLGTFAPLGDHSNSANGPKSEFGIFPFTTFTRLRYYF